MKPTNETKCVTLNDIIADRPPTGEVSTNETKWTPGPWKAFGRTVYADRSPIALGISGFDAEQPPIYADDSRYPLKDDNEAMANATLIASAPELVEALQSLVDLANDPAGRQYTLAEIFGTAHKMPQPEGIKARALLARIKEGK